MSEPDLKAPNACECLSLSTRSVLDGGQEDQVFASCDTVRVRKPPHWWVSAWKCRRCEQAWLVGTESRHNDIYCMDSISESELSKIVHSDLWPSTFDRYETLLERGSAANRSVRHVESIGDSELHALVTDLALARPGISLSELTRLLNLDLEAARKVAGDVMRDSGAVIDVRECGDTPAPK